MPARSSRTPRSMSRWGTRILSLGVGLLFLVTIASPATAAPKEPKPSEATLTELQERAAEVQQRFMDAAIAYEAATQQVNDARARAEQARATEAAARAEMEEAQEILGQYVSTMYTMGIQEQHPMLKVIAYGPDSAGDILYDQQIADIVGAQQNRALDRAKDAAARAEAAAEAAAEAEAEAEAAMATAQELLDEIQAEAAKVTTELNRSVSSLGGIAFDAEQQARNEAALRNWQDYLQRLSDAKIVPPSAAALANPAALPAPMVPLMNAAGQPIPGVAQVFANGKVLTVLSAETVSAVSHGFSQVGKPYVPGQTGPDAYDCAGFTASAWTKSGIGLAPNVADQWARGAAVAKEEVQVGDLVFTASPEAGMHHVGLYLGGGYVLDSAAARYQVGVAQVTDGFYSAVRPTLPGPANPNAVPAATGNLKFTCGAPEAPAGRAGSPQWGGFPNGMIPEAAMCSPGVGGHLLRCDAAASYKALSAAYQANFGAPMCITDSYRSFALQVTTYANKPGLAAVPGTSNHGWGLAVDLCGGIQTFGSAQYNWMKANAPRFGWINPEWAAPGNGREEPWHWEFGYVS